MAKKNIKIDLVSDVVCPWCIIGYKRLEQALESISDQVEATIHWHPFELNPHMSEEGENLRAHLSAKYGTTLEGSIRARQNLTAIGEGLGFTFNYYDDMKMYNTFKAHRVLQYAKTQGKMQDLTLRLFSAFFGEQKAINDNETLMTEATSVGLDKAEVRNILESDHFAEDVRQEQSFWTNRGVHAVPTFVINDRFAISGAQDPEGLAAAILEKA